MKKKRGKVFILSGPSGSGKTTLYRRLLKSRRLKKKIVKVVSVTTRPKRPGERHGKDYFFIDREAFDRKSKADYFLESQKVFNNHYGTPRKSVDAGLRKGKSVLLCIDVKGARVICRRIPDAVTIFIKTRTLSELKARLLDRGSEDKARLKMRLETAKKELKQGKRYKYSVINDKIPQALKRLEDILLAEIES